MYIYVAALFLARATKVVSKYIIENRIIIC